ncbi:MAG TPA: methyltransferase [Blastocatellia bacterium]|nr:methyltransferase [Blastocatellia bacterium]
MAKLAGLIIVYVGMILVVWAAVHIKGAFLGEVELRLDVLVRDGPYRFVPHPVYLGMTIALVALVVALRS